MVTVTDTESFAAHPAQQAVAKKDVKVLGVAKGRKYVTLPGGREARVGKVVRPFEFSNPIRPNEVWLEASREPRDRDELEDPVEVIVRASIVEPGTFKAVEAKEKRDASREEAKRASGGKEPARVVDALAGLAMLAASEATSQDLRPPSGDDPSALAFDALSTTHNVVSIGRTRPAARDAVAILERLAKVGVTVELVGDDLVARAPGGGLSVEARQVLRRSKPWLRAHLAKQTLRCAKPHRGEAPPAVVVTEPDACRFAQSTPHEPRSRAVLSATR